jgi:hypothetical protein
MVLFLSQMYIKKTLLEEILLDINLFHFLIEFEILAIKERFDTKNVSLFDLLMLDKFFTVSTWFEKKLNYIFNNPIEKEFTQYIQEHFENANLDFDSNIYKLKEILKEDDVSFYFGLSQRLNNFLF